MKIILILLVGLLSSVSTAMADTNFPADTVDGTNIWRLVSSRDEIPPLRVKVIYAGSDLEKTVNAWLVAHPKAVVVTTLQSVDHNMATLTIFYRDFTEKK